MDTVKVESIHTQQHTNLSQQCLQAFRVRQHKLKEGNWVRKQRGEEEGGITVEADETCARRKLAVGSEVKSWFWIEKKLVNEKERAAKDRII